MALRSIHQQHDSVDHLQPALDFATEVRVARSVDDVDDDGAVGAGSGVVDGGVLRQDRDALFLLQVIWSPSPGQPVHRGQQTPRSGATFGRLASSYRGRRGPRWPRFECHFGWRGFDQSLTECSRCHLVNIRWIWLPETPISPNGAIHGGDDGIRSIDEVVPGQPEHPPTLR